MRIVNCATVFFVYSISLLAISILIYLKHTNGNNLNNVFVYIVLLEVPNCSSSDITISSSSVDIDQSSRRRYLLSEICSPGKTSDCVSPFHYFVDKFRVYSFCNNNNKIYLYLRYPLKIVLCIVLLRRWNITIM